MRQSRTSEATTRERLLEAAATVFSEQGYERATVRGICARAGANVAGVNYHFRDKRGLYRELLRRWRTEAEERFPLDGGLGAEADITDRLRAFYRSMLLRLFHSAADAAQAHGRARVWLGDMLDAAQEGSEESDDIRRELEDHLLPMVREVLGQAPERLEHAAVQSMLGQSLVHFLGFVYKPEDFGTLLGDAPAVDRVADHMARFALGGLRALKENMHA